MAGAAFFCLLSARHIDCITGFKYTMSKLKGFIALKDAESVKYE